MILRIVDLAARRREGGDLDFRGGVLVGFFFFLFFWLR